MIHDILTASGIPYKPSRYLDPPAKTYAIYFDEQETDGADLAAEAPVIVSHTVTVELYEPKQDPEAEAAIEAAICAKGLLWEKEDRYWLQSVQRYQVVYTFDYYEKRRM